VAESAWDYDFLREEFDFLEQANYDLELTGFNTDEIDEIKPDALGDEDVQEVEAEDVEQIETDIVEGDIITIGPHRLMCGDSTDYALVSESLMQGKKADMCFTSPPYNGNTGADRDNLKKGAKGLYLDNELDNRSNDEYILFNEKIIEILYNCCCQEGIVLYNINYNRNTPSAYIDIVYNAKKKWNLIETICWEKQLSISLQGNNLTRIFEFIFVFFKGDDKPVLNKEQSACVKNLWKISNIGANISIHSACFPVELAHKAIDLYCVKKGIVIEPFGGSGSTMVAAHQLGRKCYVMELDPRYCQVIVNRMRKLDPDIEVKCENRELEL